jgi:hypothetical protein
MKIFIFTFLLIPFLTLSAATITSTTGGGNWTNPATWEGGVVPGPDDDVVIKGPVYPNGPQSCKNLTIQSGGSIDNTTETLTIASDLINDGLFRVGRLYIGGALRHNGTEFLVERDVIHLTSRGVHAVSMGPGRLFNASFQIDSLGSVRLESNVTFFTAFGIFLNGGMLELNGNELSFGQLSGLGYGINPSHPRLLQSKATAYCVAIPIFMEEEYSMAGIRRRHSN